MTEQIDVCAALALVKERLDRMPEDTSRDRYYMARIEQAAGELERTGIRLTSSVDDLMLVVDYAVWGHQNRDKGEGMPEWLRRKRRERWLQQRDT